MNNLVGSILDLSFERTRTSLVKHHKTLVKLSLAQSLLGNIDMILSQVEVLSLEFIHFLLLFEGLEAMQDVRVVCGQQTCNRCCLIDNIFKRLLEFPQGRILCKPSILVCFLDHLAGLIKK